MVREALARRDATRPDSGVAHQRMALALGIGAVVAAVLAFFTVCSTFNRSSTDGATDLDAAFQNKFDNTIDHYNPLD